MNITETSATTQKKTNIKMKTSKRNSLKITPPPANRPPHLYFQPKEKNNQLSFFFFFLTGSFLSLKNLNFNQK